jgi:hypothetical protein
LYLNIVDILPYWWRMAQSVQKAYKTGNRWQYVNALKYLSKIVPKAI